jgi:hypothetical protein
MEKIKVDRDELEMIIKSFKSVTFSKRTVKEFVELIFKMHHRERSKREDITKKIELRKNKSILKSW